MAEIDQGLKSSNPVERRLARDAGEKIKMEDSKTRRYREDLVKATMNGDKDRAWAIRDHMVERRGGRSNSGKSGKTSFFF